MDLEEVAMSFADIHESEDRGSIVFNQRTFVLSDKSIWLACTHVDPMKEMDAPNSPSEASKHRQDRHQHNGKV